MELMRDSIPMVSLAVCAAALYARAVSSRVAPGLRRLAALLPAVACFAAAPFAFSSAVLRCAAALLLAWFGAFRLALLAAGAGPLHPGLATLHFVVAAALPVELSRDGGRNGRSPRDAQRSKAAEPEPEPESLVFCALKAAVAAAVVRHSRRGGLLEGLHLFARVALYGAHVWCALELGFACAAAASAAALGGEDATVRVRPTFVRPYLASSLREFWGRQWNLPASGVLRAAVYDPLRRRAGAGKEAAILATFLVSGLMHEALVFYTALRRPTGEMAAYFLLHGACRVAEERWWRWAAGRGWPPPPPRAAATALVWAVFGATSWWVVLATACREGRQDDGARLEEAPGALEALFAAPFECSSVCSPSSLWHSAALFIFYLC